MSPNSVGAATSSSGRALHPSTGKAPRWRSCEEQGARRRARRVARASESFCSNFVSVVAFVKLHELKESLM
jgi:hypothetical protein